MDRPFHFRLERVRAIRERVEDQAKEQLAQSLASRREGEQSLSEAAARLGSAHDDQRVSLAAGAADARELIARQRYVERSERAERAAAYDLDRRDAEVGSRRTALAGAARDRQVLERLKQRKRADHLLESARREGADIDEMALSIHRRAMQAA